MPRMRALSLLSLATLLATGVVNAQNANPARPGTLNYVEGQVSIDGQVVKPSAVGTTALETGQEITTGNGKAEVLLTPGVFLRLGDHSAVKLISPDLIRTEVEVEQGSADVEVDQVYKQNDLLVDEKADRTQLLKTGLYAFDATSGILKVFDGKAAVEPQDSPEGEVKPDVVKGGHELALTGEPGKEQGFDKKAAEDPLYNWSSLRSSYLGESNYQMASQYPEGAGFAPGWAWNGGLSSYTWLPGDGAFLNPFGFGFYSPYYFGGGFGGYGYGGGYSRYGRGFHGSTGLSSGVRVGGTGIRSSGFAGSFHGGGSHR